jgi:hypothetical protein
LHVAWDPDVRLSVLLPWGDGIEGDLELFLREVVEDMHEDDIGTLDELNVKLRDAMGDVLPRQPLPRQPLPGWHFDMPDVISASPDRPTQFEIRLSAETAGTTAWALQAAAVDDPEAVAVSDIWIAQRSEDGEFHTWSFEDLVSV